MALAGAEGDSVRKGRESLQEEVQKWAGAGSGQGWGGKRFVKIQPKGEVGTGAEDRSDSEIGQGCVVAGGVGSKTEPG